MWLHESESNSIITEAYENKIFLTIIYISNNSRYFTEIYIVFFGDVTSITEHLVLAAWRHDQCISSLTQVLSGRMNIRLFRGGTPVLVAIPPVSVDVLPPDQFVLLAV